MPIGTGAPGHCMQNLYRPLRLSSAGSKDKGDTLTTITQREQSGSKLGLRVGRPGCSGDWHPDGEGIYKHVSVPDRMQGQTVRDATKAGYLAGAVAPGRSPNCSG